MRQPEQYGELRMLDLVCKLARASPHNVTNMLNAINVVSEHFDTTPEAVMSLLSFNGRPSPANVAACSQAAADITNSRNFDIPPARPRPPQRIARRAARN
jgi:hypothetical protein